MGENGCIQLNIRSFQNKRQSFESVPAVWLPVFLSGHASVLSPIAPKFFPAVLADCKQIPQSTIFADWGICKQNAPCYRRRDKSTSGTNPSFAARLNKVEIAPYPSSPRLAVNSFT